MLCMAPLAQGLPNDCILNQSSHSSEDSYASANAIASEGAPHSRDFGSLASEYQKQYGKPPTSGNREWSQQQLGASFTEQPTDLDQATLIALQKACSLVPSATLSSDRCTIECAVSDLQVLVDAIGVHTNSVFQLRNTVTNRQGEHRFRFMCRLSDQPYRRKKANKSKSAATGGAAPPDTRRIPTATLVSSASSPEASVQATRLHSTPLSSPDMVRASHMCSS